MKPVPFLIKATGHRFRFLIKEGFESNRIRIESESNRIESNSNQIKSNQIRFGFGVESKFEIQIRFDLIRIRIESNQTRTEPESIRFDRIFCGILHSTEEDLLHYRQEDFLCMEVMAVCCM